MLKVHNSKRSKILHLRFPLIAISLVVLTVFLAHKFQQTAFDETGTNNGIGNSCTFVNETCEFLIGPDLAIAHFSEVPNVEESVFVTFAIPEKYKIESAWIEGVNMYMGKIPVLLEKDPQGQWTGWFMLGSCASSAMRWQLRLNIDSTQVPSYLYFETHQ